MSTGSHILVARRYLRQQSLRAIVRTSMERTASMKIEAQGAVTATSPRVKAVQAQAEKDLLDLLGVDFQAMIDARRMRDGDKAHITIARPQDMKKAVILRSGAEGISKSEATRRLEAELPTKTLPDSFQVKGYGAAKNAGKVAFFVVLDWRDAESFRESLGLDPQGQDFHITVGFGPGGDVFDVPKNRVLTPEQLRDFLS